MTGFYYDDLEMFERNLDKAARLLERGKLRKVLVEAMKPIEEAAKQGAPHETGAMRDAIKTRSLIYGGTVFRITTGVHRVDWPEADETGEYVPAYVEYGHAGPEESSPPTPAHPFLRPAFDTHKDEAFYAVGAGVAQLLKDNGL